MNSGIVGSRVLVQSLLGRVFADVFLLLLPCSSVLEPVLSCC